MDILDHSDDDEEQSRSGGLGSRFGKRRAKQRYVGGHQHLLLMDCVGGSDNGDASEETVPLPDYERLSQSARLPDDPGPKDPPPPLTQVQPQPPPPQQLAPAKREPSPPLPTPTQQQKPAAWRLIDYVRSRNKAGGGGGGGGGGGADGAAGGCGGGSDADSKSSDGDKESEDGSEEGKDKKKKKKRSSWLPDPDRRWPVQGFY